MIKKLNFKNLGLGIFPKLLLSFMVLSIVPLVVLGYMASKNTSESGMESVSIAKEMGDRNFRSAKELGRKAIEDSVVALDNKSTEAIEVRTVDLAQRVADFLYERDEDILILASFKLKEIRAFDEK